nr:chromate efflux transporter [uncultured Sphingomonas sp.]
MPLVGIASRQMGRLAIFFRFLRFGFLAFGGPVAQIAMIRRELVDTEHWISSERFNRLLAVYQVLPGPEAHELCVHLGRMKGGRLGGFLAGLGFMLPGFLLVLAFAALYSRINLRNPGVAATMLGMQIAVIAMIAIAVQRIGKHILIDRWLWAIGIASFAATMAGVSFWIVLPAAGLCYVLARANRNVALVIGIIVAVGAGFWNVGLSDDPHASASSAAITLFALFIAGLKGGLLTFGGAYTAIPFVRNDTVDRGWIGEGQFLDGLALSGMMPAPLVIFVTFTGYLIAGLGGAFAMTAGMFLPAFSFGLIFYDRLEAVIEDVRLHNMLEGVAAGVVGLIAATAIELGLQMAGRLPSLPIGIALFVVALAILWSVKSRWTPLCLIPLLGLAGFLLLR